MPDMALNLDMGSYDYCRFSENGREIGCGILGGTAKLSNLLVMSSE